MRERGTLGPGGPRRSTATPSSRRGRGRFPPGDSFGRGDGPGPGGPAFPDRASSAAAAVSNGAGRASAADPDRDFRRRGPAPMVVGGRVRRARRRAAAAAFQLPARPLRARRSALVALGDADRRRGAGDGRDLRTGAPAAARRRRRRAAARRRRSQRARAGRRAATKWRPSRTAFNAMADDLSARAEALAASDRARRQLLADVSHELTTPVTAMRGYLETLSMPELSSTRRRATRYLGIVGDETGAARAHDRRPARPRAARRRRRLAASSTTCRSRAAVRPGAGAARAGVGRRGRDDDDDHRAGRRRSCGAIAIASSRRCRTWPPTRCATRRQDRRSSCGARRVGDAIALTVTDQGAGIAAEHLPHVFDRFYKADASRAVRPGRPPAAAASASRS